MRRILMAALLLFAGCTMLLAGCSKRLPPVPAEPVLFQRGEIHPAGKDHGYAAVENDGRVYVPYGTLRGRGLFGDLTYAFGDCLGYLEDDQDVLFYALEGESTIRWLVEYERVGIMEQPVVLREIGAGKSVPVPDCVEPLQIFDFWEDD